MDDYEIKNHFLYINGQRVQYKASPNKSGVMKPVLSVVHDTAGHLTKGGAANWLCNPKAGASAHFVTERDGEIVQLVPTNRIAWHAGKSSYKGRSGCNHFSIGNEIANPGMLKKTSDGKYQSWFKTKYDKSEGIAFGKVDNGKHSFSGYAMDYTPEQIEASLGILIACREAYGITEVAPHWQISPGRKVDTNPLFPLASIRARLMGREIETDLGDQSPGLHAGHIVETTALVNARKYPSFYDNVLAVLKPKTRCVFVKASVYTRQGGYGQTKVICDKTTDEWTQVKVEGYPEPMWVMSQYLGELE